MRNIAAGTIVSKRNLPQARVIADTFLEHHPGASFFVLLTDEVDGRFDPQAEPFRLLHLSDMNIAGLTRFRFNYSEQELSYAATPSLLEFILDQGFPAAIFLKQESLVFGDLSYLFDGPGRSIVLTPHLLEPLPGKDAVARELNILQAGVYNGGFVGVAGSEPGRDFLKWWQERLYRHCRLDTAGGMHFEQRWLDLVPVFFPEVIMERDPGLNVAHWNLPERTVTIDRAGAVFVDGQPCRLFRFSGFDADNPGYATRYHTRLAMEDLGAAAAVYTRYLQLLEDAGYHESCAWPYAYGHFDNGVPIPHVARQIFRDLEDVARFGDPFETYRPDSFFNWINRSEGSDALTRLWSAIYAQRPDLQKAYPDPEGADLGSFREWCRLFGTEEHDIHASFLENRSGDSRD
jgi:hypothetical protein